MRRTVALLAGVLAVAGCTVGPNYQPQKPPVPDTFVGPQALAQPETPVDLAHWWTAFGDPELDRLIELGLRNAPNLQTAASRLREARYQVVQSRAAGLPQVSGTGNAEYLRFQRLGHNDVPDLLQRFGQNGGSGGSGDAGAGGSQFGSNGNDFPDDLKMFSAGFDATWELDLFGRVRRQVEASRAQVEAAAWNLRDARVSLAAEIANDYLQMRGYQTQARIAQDEADRQARSLSILENTAKAGLVPQGNAIRQRTQLAQARAQVAPLAANALVQIDAIAVLIGATPETLTAELNSPRPLAPAPAVIPPGLPVDLIRRRPDVRAAERQLAAATAQIGVAVADLYPRITLNLAPTLGADYLGGFFLGKLFNLTAQGQASFPIFDFGRRRAQININREEREQAYITWRQTVLGALRDVEDALVRTEAERRSNAQLAGGVKDATRSLAAVTAQFRAGLDNYTPVLDGQQQLLQAQNSLAQSDVRLRQDLASLYKALGGGWSPHDAPPLRPEIVDAPKREARR